uniref:V-type proton ATPase subunit C n=1 Tax=Molossus molossus TaxID=27622 RepID=A0A7J8DSR8_MOLMO|nr:ATPase H+ transporting V1 subunit C1 [Molossus molossus]
MTEFWLISAPGEKTCQQTWEKLHAATTKNNNLAVSSKFNIPDLKVGTLDVLVGLSDELAKLDAFVEGVVKKVAQYMADVLEDSKDNPVLVLVYANRNSLKYDSTFNSLTLCLLLTPFPPR